MQHEAWRRRIHAKSSIVKNQSKQRQVEKEKFYSENWRTTLLFKGFPATIIRTWCAVISVCAPRLSFGISCLQCCSIHLSYVSICLCYMYSFNAIYDFSMRFSFWEGKTWVLLFENFNLFSLCNHNYSESIFLVHHNLVLLPITISHILF